MSMLSCVDRVGVYIEFIGHADKSNLKYCDYNH